MKLEFSQHIFEKYSNITFHKNSSSKAKLFQADGQTDRQTDMLKLIVAFQNFAKVSKKLSVSW